MSDALDWVKFIFENKKFLFSVLMSLVSGLGYQSWNVFEKEKTIMSEREATTQAIVYTLQQTKPEVEEVKDSFEKRLKRLENRVQEKHP